MMLTIAGTAFLVLVVLVLIVLLVMESEDE